MWCGVVCNVVKGVVRSGAERCGAVRSGAVCGEGGGVVSWICSAVQCSAVQCSVFLLDVN